MSIEAYIRESIAGLRQELAEWAREMVRQNIANLLTSTTIARSSEDDADPLAHDVEMFGSADGAVASNADGERARPRARHVEAPCFAYVPLEKEPVKVMGIGANLLMWAAASTRYRPKGIKKSEFAIYNLRAAGQQLVIKGDKDSALTVKVGTFLHLEVNKDGQVAVKSKAAQKITIDAGDGADVVVNGGTLRVARVTDGVVPNADFTLWMNAVDTAIKELALGNPPVPPGSSFSPIGLIDPNDGALRFKG